MRTDFLPFALPDVDAAELEQIRESLDSGWVTTGPKTHQFEAEFAAYVGAKHAIAVNSCTAAMHLSHRYAQKSTEPRTGTEKHGKVQKNSVDFRVIPWLQFRDSIPVCFHGC